MSKIFQQIGKHADFYLRMIYKWVAKILLNYNGTHNLLTKILNLNKDM